MLKNKLLLVALLLTSTLSVLDNSRVEAALHSDQNHIWTVLTDSITSQFGKYNNLFREPDYGAFDDVEGSPESTTGQRGGVSLWGQLLDATAIIMNTPSNRQKKKERFQRHTGEGSAIKRQELNKNIRENNELDKQLDNGEYLNDKQHLQKLFDRQAHKYNINHNGHFKSAPEVVYDFIHQDRADKTEIANGIETEAEVLIKNEAEIFDQPSKRRNLQLEEVTDSNVTTQNLDIFKQSEVEGWAINDTTNLTSFYTIYGEWIDPDVLPEIILYKEIESYPIENSMSYSCQNGGEFVFITQNYKNCYLKSNENDAIRVTNETWSILQEEPYYIKRVDCRVEPETNQACWCPKGYTGAYCHVQEYSKCYVNITQPAFYEGCKGKYPSGDNYDYSIQGFDPCFFFDFNDEIEVKYRLLCKAIDFTGTVKEAGHEEELGYEYLDLVATTSLLESQKFTYAAQNNETNMFVNEGQSLTVAWDFRDWRYMTNFIRFEQNVTDLGVIVGTDEASLMVNLSAPIEADSQGGTKFEVAGRLFFEAHAFSSWVVTFTTNGFLDREGYQEPQLMSTSNFLLKAGLLVVGLLALTILVYFCVKRQEKKNLELKKTLTDHRQRKNRVSENQRN